MNVVARAPGKAVLLGEYVVLEGAPALVAALEVAAEARYAVHDAAEAYTLAAPQLGVTAELVPQGGTLVPRGALPPALGLLAAVAQDAYGRGALPPGTLSVDTRAFYRDGHKLGLGSSAAVAVAAWHALRAAAGAATPSAVPAPLEEAVVAVTELHRRAQGGSGSGVDVAASTLGGIVRFQLPGLPGSQNAAGQVACPLQGQRMPVLVPVVAGRGSATAPFLRAFAALKAREPRTYWQLLEPLAQLSAAACEMWALGEVRALLPVVDAYREAMDALGQAIGMPVVSSEHRALAKLAQRCGAAYKPTGAGGGDVGLGFCIDEAAADKLRRLWRRAGHAPLSGSIATHGVRTQLA